MRGRTIILVSHHVQLCAPGASYIVALDNGRLQFQGGPTEFQASGVLNVLSQSGATDPTDAKEDTVVPDVEDIADSKAPSPTNAGDSSETTSTTAPTAVDAEVKPEQKKAPRKLVEEEKRAVGRIGKDIWATYLGACGGPFYWTLFTVSLVVAAASPVLENGWLKYILLFHI
jgi:ABC-type multidrug transport system ATPase subunit